MGQAKKAVTVAAAAAAAATLNKLCCADEPAWIKTPYCLYNLSTSFC